MRDTSEDGVLAIQVGSRRQGDEKLRTYEERAERLEIT